MDATAIIWIILYFIPTLIAAVRQHHNGIPIFLVNFLLGWTAIGWIVALVWSCTAVQPQLQATSQANPAQRQHEGSANEPSCPYCFGSVDPRAQKCPHCAEWIVRGIDSQPAQAATSRSQVRQLKQAVKQQKKPFTFQGKSKHLKYLGGESDKESS